MRKSFKPLYRCLLFTIMTALLMFAAAPAMAETVTDSVYLNSIVVTTENPETPVGLRVPLEIKLYDTNGDLFVPSEDVVVDFTVENGGIFENSWDLYDTAVGGNKIASSFGGNTGLLTIPAGESSLMVWLKLNVAGEYSFSVTDGEFSGSVDITSAQLPGTQLDMLAELNEWGYAEVDAGDRIAVDIYFYDQFGNNPAYEGPVTVNLYTNSPEGNYYSSADASDTAPITSVQLIKQEDGTVGARVYYSDTLANTRAYEDEDYWGDTYLSVSKAGIEADQAWVIVRPLAATSVILDTDRHVFVGEENEFVITYVDRYGNPTNSSYGNQLFSVTSSNGGLFYQNGVQVSQIELDTYYGEGYFYFEPSTVGLTTITVSAENVGMTATLDVNVYEYEGHGVKELQSGWNTLSVPIMLDDMSLQHILGPDRGYVEAIYGYVNGQFTQITDLSTQIKPLDAVFVKVAEGKTVRIYLDLADIPTTITAPPAKDLNAGWNFVGTAFFESDMPVDVNFTSVSGKYSQVISPLYNSSYYAKLRAEVALLRSYGEPWIYVPGQMEPYPVEVFNGYWVFMREPGTLAGFSYTPVPFASER